MICTEYKPSLICMPKVTVLLSNMYLWKPALLLCLECEVFLWRKLQAANDNDIWRCFPWRFDGLIAPADVDGCGLVEVMVEYPVVLRTRSCKELIRKDCCSVFKSARSRLQHFCLDNCKWMLHTYEWGVDTAKPQMGEVCLQLHIRYTRWMRPHDTRHYSTENEMDCSLLGAFHHSHE